MNSKRIFQMASQSRHSPYPYGDVMPSKFYEYWGYIENIYGDTKDLSQAEVRIIVNIDRSLSYSYCFGVR